MSLKICLTGGIASGKTLAVNYIFDYCAKAKKTIVFFDADQIAREVLQNDGSLLEKIAHHFGKNILKLDGTLNRPKMREIVFHNEEEKKVLEDILHPAIFARIQKLIAENEEQDVVCIALPLYFETKHNLFFDAVVSIIAEKACQKERLIKRDKISPQLAEKIIDSQIDNEYRKKHSDFIVENCSDQKTFRQNLYAVLAKIIR